MSDPNFDGLCGTISPFLMRGGMPLRCQHPLCHHGDHSWEKYRSQFMLRPFCGTFKIGVATFCKPSDG